MSNSTQVQILYLCNAIDEHTMVERGISYASPAATNKVFGICKALHTQNIKVQVVSLGKGKQTGNHNKYASVSKSLNGFSIHYASFWHYSGITHFVGIISLFNITRELVEKYRGKTIIVAYNRLWQYLPSLIYSFLHGGKNFLDLEDGPNSKNIGISLLRDRFSRYLFGFLCPQGSILSTKYLTNQVTTKHNYICYGCSEPQQITSREWTQYPLEILFSGNLHNETGINLLFKTIDLINLKYPEIEQKIKITITGNGMMEKAIQEFSRQKENCWVHFLGNIQFNDYLKILEKSHIGLNLRLSTSEMGKTTFPSKIIEYASYGLGIISTRVSDVPLLLDEQSAMLLEEDTPECLAGTLYQIATGKVDIQSMAKRGQEKINSVANYAIVGKKLKQFLTDENPSK